MKAVMANDHYPDGDLLRTDLPAFIADMPRHAVYTHGFNTLMFFVDKKKVFQDPVFCRDCHKVKSFYYNCKKRELPHCETPA